ncbi:MAG: bifunctional 4-hydroxy-2-oxoglutarate aldolase/2-dehydro-3-deoxy-phosphogluconate aldolase [Burkholderiales bacterium]|nr:bifunctional 4-hydroxy-2-oxoglutarate aldolase/2-dehydro-3-deoxy-phosphogluconate aldolase [Burkholderiales bacterium]MDQ3195347.1 bifunctional 4-hydroxy-2-oxoglutarate aldolase/2-dehydro-3-deoxy-phosphogluconate aldolase [Pseudomonadota bacterium]
MNIREILDIAPVIPVLVIGREEDAIPLARALVTGGLRVLEITLRTPVGLAAIAAIAADVPDAVVGVGTVTRADEFQRAKDAGARFAVSPGFSPELAEAARACGMPYLPGAMTPTEIMAARNAGFHELKFFPAQRGGGLAALASFAELFADVAFCPTGGIDEKTFADYLALDNVVCVGGSWLAPRDAIANRDWTTITRLAMRAAKPVDDSHLDEDDAMTSMTGEEDPGASTEQISRKPKHTTPGG